MPSSEVPPVEGSQPGKRVQVAAGYAFGTWVEDTTVTLVDAGEGRHSVALAGLHIGYVWKGTRRYSPPTHKGSRIAKYHKQVPEWQGGEYRFTPQFRRDTRQEVLRELVSEARRLALGGSQAKGSVRDNKERQEVIREVRDWLVRCAWEIEHTEEPIGAGGLVDLGLAAQAITNHYQLASEPTSKGSE